MLFDVLAPLRIKVINYMLAAHVAVKYVMISNIKPYAALFFPESVTMSTMQAETTADTTSSIVSTPTEDHSDTPTVPDQRSTSPDVLEFTSIADDNEYTSASINALQATTRDWSGSTWTGTVENTDKVSTDMTPTAMLETQEVTLISLTSDSTVGEVTQEPSTVPVTSTPSLVKSSVVETTTHTTAGDSFNASTSTVSRVHGTGSATLRDNNMQGRSTRRDVLTTDYNDNTGSEGSRTAQLTSSLTFVSARENISEITTQSTHFLNTAGG